MRRDLFTEDHEAFRELASDFVEKEVARLIRSAEN
jgi:acyl-CoA dehydrogenase